MAEPQEIAAHPPADRRHSDGSVSSVRRGRFDPGLWAAFGVAGLYLLTILASGRAGRALASDLFQMAAALGGGGWGLWGFWKGRAAPDQARRSAGFLMAAVAAWGAGQAVWCLTEFVRHESPFPSWADAGYVTASMAMVVGILFLPSRPLPTVSRLRALLDSVLITVGVIAFGWFFVLGPTFLGAHGSAFAKVLGATYPTLDLVVVFGILFVAARPSGRAVARIRNLLFAAAIAYVVSDAAFALANLAGTYQSGGPLDAGWMVANVLIGRTVYALRGLGSLATEEVRPEPFGRIPGLAPALMPYALFPAVAGLVGFVWQTRVAGPLAGGVYLCAILLIVLVLVRQVFSILENQRLVSSLRKAYQELEALATTDGMTGLANHRAFQERLRADLATERPLSLLLVDVDHFKDYNDRFGHPAGDEALRIVARLLRQCVRDSDLPARYGGEEFAVVLPGTPGAEAWVVAERIRRATESESFPHRAVTLSVGIASMSGGEADVLIEAADRALYAAKRGGRNRAVAANAGAAGFLIVVSEAQTTVGAVHRAA